MSNLAERWSEVLTPAIGGEGFAPAWLSDLREAAAGQFRAAGLPHRKVEAWKYTPMKAFESFDLRAAEPAAAPEAHLPPPLCDKASVVDIHDGILGGLPKNLPPGFSLLPLAEGLKRFEERLKPLFEAVDVRGPSRAFAALNTALAQQGLVVHVTGESRNGPRDARLLLRWGFSSGAAAMMNQFRLFVLLDDGAGLNLVEQFGGIAGGTGGGGGLNTLYQADLGTGSRLEHTRVQAESDEAVLLATTMIEQGRDSCYRYRGFDLGAALARQELTVRLSGPGAEADIAGAQVHQLLDTRAGIIEHTQQDGVPATRSRVQIRLGEDFGEVLLGEIANDWACMASQGNGQDLLALEKMVRHFRLHIAEKRMQRRETMVPGGDRGVPVVAQVIKKRLHERRVDIGDGQTFQRHAPDVAAVAQKQCEDVAVGLDGIGAQIALSGQVMGQEVGHLHG